MSPLASNLPSIISPSLISIAVVAKSFVILALSNLDDIARINPKTKSPVNTLVLYPYLT